MTKINNYGRGGPKVRMRALGFDVTFTPVKSVSSLWAVAPRDVAEQIEAAHEAAVDHALAWLEQQVAHTRRGAQVVRQVEVRGLGRS